MPTLQGARVRSLVGELRSHIPCRAAKTTTTNKQAKQNKTFPWVQEIIDRYILKMFFFSYLLQVFLFFWPCSLWDLSSPGNRWWSVVSDTAAGSRKWRTENWLFFLVTWSSWWLGEEKIWGEVESMWDWSGFKREWERDFPGGPVGKTPGSQCRGPGSIPGGGTSSRMLQLGIHVLQLKDPACCNEDPVCHN